MATSVAAAVLAAHLDKTTPEKLQIPQNPIELVIQKKIESIKDPVKEQAKLAFAMLRAGEIPVMNINTSKLQHFAGPISGYSASKGQESIDNLNNSADIQAEIDKLEKKDDSMTDKEFDYLLLLQEKLIKLENEKQARLDMEDKKDKEVIKKEIAIIKEMLTKNN